MNRKLYWFSVILAVIGVIVSVYMTIYKLTSNNAMCLGSGDCSTVNASPYSEIYGIPVSFVGVLGYGAILGSLLLSKSLGNFFENNNIYVIFGLTLSGFAFTIYLVYLEIFVLKALCPFCVTSQITMTVLFFTTIVRLLRQPVN